MKRLQGRPVKYEQLLGEEQDWLRKIFMSRGILYVRDYSVFRGLDSRIHAVVDFGINECDAEWTPT